MYLLLLYCCAVYVPIDAWQNEYVEEMQVRGEHFTPFPSVRPYELNDLYLDEHARATLLFVPNFSAVLIADTVDVTRLKPALYYDWSHYTVFVQPVVKFGHDSLPPRKQFEDVFSADYERAYAKYTHTNVTIFVGRERFSVGPSPRYNLLLSGYSAPLDWLHYSLQSRKVKFSYFLSRLDDLYTKPLEYIGDTVSTYITAIRYLTIKRFDYSPTAWFNVGLSEGAIFGGEGSALEMYHFNPVILLQSYQFNQDKDVNLFMSVDGKMFFPNLSLYATLLIDDFQLEKDPNNEPNHFALALGIECADLFNLRTTFWQFEYTLVSRYTYAHFRPYQRYIFQNTALGAPYGSDYDEFVARCVYHTAPRLDFYAHLSLLRKGETYSSSLWPIPENPRVPGTFFPNDNILSGVIQHTMDIELGMRLLHSRWLCSELTLGYLWTGNYHHIRGESENSFLVRAQLDVVMW